MNPVYGRSDQIARARTAIARAVAGHGATLLFTGEPGIGKTRLAEQVALDAVEQGAVVAWGRCWEVGGAPAYWPWMQVFRSLELSVDPFVNGSRDLALGSAEARFAALDRALRALLAVAARAPLVLILDDLHAADAPSLLLLILLSRELARAPLLVVGAYRDAEVSPRSDLAALLGKLVREAEVMPLARLPPAAVEAWIRAVSPEADAARAQALYQLTEGQPLFVVEALRLGPDAQQRSAWSLGPRAVLDERLSRLSSEARSVLEVAAVAGREFALDDVVRASGSARDHVYGALLAALATSLLVTGGAEGQFRFSHVLLRDRLYAQLLPSQRAALHYRLGALAADGGDIHSAAHHLLSGSGGGPAERIAEVTLMAAEAALSRLAFEDAADLARRALALPDTSPWHGSLQVIAAEALIRVGDDAAGKALCVEAAAHARAADQPLLFARAALAYGAELATGTLDPRMIALLREALQLLDPADSALRARVLARLCAALTPPERAQDAGEIRALMRAALSMARSVGDPHALLYVLQFAGTVGLLVPERERFGLLEETLALARKLDQPLVILYAMPAYLTQLIALGGLDQALALLPEYDRLLGESRQSGQRVRHLAVRSLLAAMRGDWEAVARMDEEARVLARGEGASGRQFTWLVHRVALAELVGEPALIAQDGPALTSMGASPSTAQDLIWFLAGAGRREEAQRLLADITLDADPGVPRLWYLHSAADSCVMLGDRAFATELYPHARRAADRDFWTVGPGAIIGPSSRALGDLAMLLGRIPEAVAHYQAAIAASERFGAAWLTARCRKAHAAALAALASPARVETAPPTHTRAIALAREGEVWAIRWGDAPPLRIKHVKGLHYLQQLIERPGSELHVIELASLEHRPGDAGPVLDSHAKAAYRARLELLREQRAQAEQLGDAARAEQVEAELTAIAEQLAAAVGLGGRDRRAASDVERMRVNVQRRLKDAIDRIAAADPALGRYLSAAVKTGTTCVFQPV